MISQNIGKDCKTCLQAYPSCTWVREDLVGKSSITLIPHRPGCRSGEKADEKMDGRISKPGNNGINQQNNKVNDG